MNIQETRAEIEKAGGKILDSTNDYYPLQEPIEMLVGPRKVLKCVIGFSVYHGSGLVLTIDGTNVDQFQEFEALPKQAKRLMTAKECFGKVLRTDVDACSLITDIAQDTIMFDGAWYSVGELQSDGYKISDTIDGEKRDFYIEDDSE